MSFIKDLIEGFTGKDKRPDDGSQGYYSQQQQYGPSQSSDRPPEVPVPWVAEWDSRDNRWLYVNRETGERTFEHPQAQGYGQGDYYPEGPPKQSHTGRNVALGVVAGLAGGALLMHEGEKVEEKWDEDKYRFDNDVSNGTEDVEDFPEDAVRWTGRKVGEVENVPQDIEKKWDDGVQDVEAVPDDVAGLAGRRVGDVERFGDDVDRYGDNIADSYDQGRNDARYRDDY
ncbi:uncharacterized protein A1O9_07214 [Exophiala aquamarina CBS 119918]|uniref:WW domain-containing protein n=1 Tax=Exophiala aquamarina CBS 119918 TaxID=1182545 RepID=A0A072PA87_9EURO|nr:uncharacterized protein A1O9_07214 [Exophiala aquamarina CBS 119918]KEF57024.1 hypothetical protein A1O9_07214 [Exophiala aquamarina CBS 119918]